MKNQGVLVERYSQALFSLSQKKGNSNEILNDFSKIDEALKFEPSYKLFFSALLPNSLQLQLWEKLLKNLKSSDCMKGFVDLLVKNSRIQIFKKVYDRYLILVNESQGIITAEVCSAEKLDKKTIDTIYKELCDLTGKKIELKSSQDSSLIGGLIIKVGSKLHDSSIKSLLKNLENNLRNNQE